jgi:hypothetical protein
MDMSGLHAPVNLSTPLSSKPEFLVQDSPVNSPYKVPRKPTGQLKFTDRNPGSIKWTISSIFSFSPFSGATG